MEIEESSKKEKQMKEEIIKLKNKIARLKAKKINLKLDNKHLQKENWFWIDVLSNYVDLSKKEELIKIKKFENIASMKYFKSKIYDDVDESPIPIPHPIPNPQKNK